MILLQCANLFFGKRRPLRIHLKAVCQILIKDGQRQGISSNGDVLQNFSDVNRSNQVDLGLEDSVLARFRILQHQVESYLNKTLVQGTNILDNISQRGNSSGLDKVHNVEIEDHLKKTVDLSLADSDPVMAGSF